MSKKTDKIKPPSIARRVHDKAKAVLKAKRTHFGPLNMSDEDWADLWKEKGEANEIK